jgi:site-specific DNA-adenine methylase
MSNYIKSPVNWVGNKYKYLDTINKLISGKKYKNVYELFFLKGCKL